MSKKSKQDRMMAEIDSSGFDWDILSRDGDRIDHVRVEGFGDIWPTTGSAKLKSGEWIKKNPDKLIGKLRGNTGKAKEEPRKSKEDRLTALESKVRGLEETMEYLIRNLEEIDDNLKV